VTTELLFYGRQQLEEIRLKKEKLEAVTRKKKTQRKEELHGESAGHKPQIHCKTTAPTARLAYRSTRMWDRKVPCPCQWLSLGLCEHC